MLGTQTLDFGVSVEFGAWRFKIKLGLTPILPLFDDNVARLRN